jgi:hypothetical protein
MIHWAISQISYKNSIELIIVRWFAFKERAHEFRRFSKDFNRFAWCTRNGRKHRVHAAGSARIGQHSGGAAFSRYQPG